MHSEELIASFEQQAAGYDKQWDRLAPVRDGLHFVLESAFANLPLDARILCVGVGTGAELERLAKAYPKWSFTAVDPARAMLAVCRRRAEAGGFASRCHFHEGYLDSLPIDEAYDAATCFLVSQFILERAERVHFFHMVAGRLRPGGLLASSDLAGQLGSPHYEVLLGAWLAMMARAGVPPEGLERMRAAYSKDVAVLSSQTVSAIIQAGGFDPPVLFYQAGLLHAWLASREAADAA
jgi:tRNA (cmo5U34)-methyltransferase